MNIALILTGLALLQLKHFVADFMLQPKYVFSNKGRYGHPGGLIHAGVHMLATIPVLMVMGVGAFTIALVVIAEGIVHYHLDFGKDRIGARWDMKITEWRYWALFGLDQFLHQMTYVAILWIASL